MITGGVVQASVTVGNFNSRDCYPLMCNDSGTDVGQSIDYQQVYTSGAFSGPMTIDLISWYYDSTGGGGSDLLGGLYTVYWGYAAFGSVNNLSTNLPSNYVSARTLIASVLVPPGGFDISTGVTLSLDAAQKFTYDPALGNLLLEIVVTNQDNVPTGTGNGYNQADQTGSVTSRAYCVSGMGCFSDSTGLVTTFADSTIPEPGTLVMVSFGMIVVSVVVLRRKRNE
jgi:hypothetical protein